ncbi:hypothetical protein [Mycobacteroides abscessus]
MKAVAALFDNPESGLGGSYQDPYTAKFTVLSDVSRRPGERVVAWGAGTIHRMKIEDVRRVELVDGTRIKKVAYVELLDAGALKIVTVVKQKKAPTCYDVDYLANGQWKRIVAKLWTLVVDTEDGRSAEVGGLTTEEFWVRVEKILREDGNDEAEVKRLAGLLAQGEKGPLSASGITFKMWGR